MADQIQAALEYLSQGGWVMVPLAIVSIVMWTLIFERLLSYRTLARRDMLRERLWHEYERDRYGLPDRPDQPGRSDRPTQPDQPDQPGHPAFDRAALRMSARRIDGDIERYLAIITVLVAVAPLLGLLGTVLGMTETFEVIAPFGTGNTRALASGISVALITTQTGLLIAVPGLFLRGRLRGQAEGLHSRLDELVTILDRRLNGSVGLQEARP